MEHPQKEYVEAIVEAFRKGYDEGIEAIAEAINDGREEGIEAIMEIIEKGREEAHDEGYDEGHVAGYKEGFEKGYSGGVGNIVLQMYENGITIEQIAEMTNSSIDEIEQYIWH